MVRQIKTSSTTLTVLSLLASGTAAHNSTNGTSYNLKHDLSGENFFANFKTYSDADPTKGFVQYQTAESAIANEHMAYINSSIFLGVDYTTKDPKGRASVRIESTLTLNHGLLVADIAHMPASVCGVWPAFWLLGKETWPMGGEVDILEGVNDYDHNAVTLHTSTGCVVDNSTSANEGAAEEGEHLTGFSGSMTTSDCDVNAANQDKNVGCSIKAPRPGSQNYIPTYGSDFNANGGGIYIVELADTSITVWFFPRSSPSSNSATTFPSAPENLLTAPNSSTFPIKSLARFQGPGCDFNARFRDLRIIFNTAFCGEWAGKEWESGGCKAKTGVETCEEWVRENPEMFVEAFWEVRGLAWFEKDGKGNEGEKGKKMGLRGRGREAW